PAESAERPLLLRPGAAGRLARPHLRCRQENRRGRRSRAPGPDRGHVVRALRGRPAAAPGANRRRSALLAPVPAVWWSPADVRARPPGDRPADARGLAARPWQAVRGPESRAG